MNREIFDKKIHLSVCFHLISQILIKLHNFHSRWCLNIRQYFSVTIFHALSLVIRIHKRGIPKPIVCDFVFSVKPFGIPIAGQWGWNVFSFSMPFVSFGDFYRVHGTELTEVVVQVFMVPSDGNSLNEAIVFLIVEVLSNVFFCHIRQESWNVVFNVDVLHVK